VASDWILSNPINHTRVSDIPQEIRNVKYLLKSRLIYAAAEPAVRQDGKSFAEGDNGSIWIDSGDNKMYVLTDYSVPTWTLASTEVVSTLLASARAFLAALSVEMADATLTLQNTDEEDSDGGRQSSVRFKGEQSGGEVSTLGYIQLSHEGTEDDQKGQLSIFVNDGDDNNAPSKEALRIQSTGKIDVANSLAVLDEDDMTSDDAECVPTQQSVKAYVDSHGIVQVVNTQNTTAVTVENKIFPMDGSIPQNTEGAEFFTLAITPTSATNKLRIEVTVVASTNVNSMFACAALFQDDTANCLACAANNSYIHDKLCTVTFSYYMDAGTTSETTFKVRVGSEANCKLTVNGEYDNRSIYGGKETSSITITEIAV